MSFSTLSSLKRPRMKNVLVKRCLPFLPASVNAVMNFRPYV